MFQVKREENELIELEKPTFTELNIREREHLQEWLANKPDALGEDLLIVQKEFAGFEGTLERLDLLALDKDGCLVVIENKLDDAGRDVVWQALKYAAYCSTLTKVQIIEIYQEYLDRDGSGQDATTNLCEFLKVEELDEVVLNASNDQRVILVAANFRKEVTSTALWLIGHGVNVQCVQVALYGFGEELFVDLKRIIPPLETADFMIMRVAKDSEEKSVQDAQSRTHILRHKFWSKVLEELKGRNVKRYDNISPSKDHWLASSTGISSCSYLLIFSRKFARVELDLARPNSEENEWIFDRLHEARDALEESFGSELQWERKEGRKSCRISFSQPFDGFNEDSWPEMIRWLCNHFVSFDKAFSEQLARLNDRLKSEGVSGET